MSTLATWGVFIVFGIVAYTLISYYGMVTSNAQAGSPLEIVSGIVTHPAGVFAMIVGNLLFAVALYYGFQLTPSALSIMYATGVITGYAYTYVTGRTEVSGLHLLGVLFIILGIWLLSTGTASKS